METITLKVELLKPTKAKEQLYTYMTALNTAFSNFLLDCEALNKATSKIYHTFSTEKLPSAIVNQTIRDVKSKKRHQKAKTFRSFWCGFNNQNLNLEKENGLYKASFPTMEKRVAVPLVVKPYQQYWIERLFEGTTKQGTTTLYQKNNRWYFAISISYEPVEVDSSAAKVMGVDVGLNNLAVASVGTKSLFFKGDEVAYRRRKFASYRKKLGQKKKLQAIRSSKNRESRWMKEKNHQISRQIVDFAIVNGVRCVRLEDLTGIQKTIRSKKEAGRNLHSWSHFQLQQFIAYKAKMAGMEVEYVDPRNTSKQCRCGYAHKKNRSRHDFFCTSCGYTAHADLNAAINIAHAISGMAEKRNDQTA